MQEDDIARFVDSFERCMERPDFFDLFYARFLASSPEVAAKFEGTDFTKQKKALKASLYHMLAGVAKKDGTLSMLRDVAHRHGRSGKDIRPGLYELWLDTLVRTAADCDERFTPETDRAWREAMRPGIEYLKAYY